LEGLVAKSEKGTVAAMKTEVVCGRKKKVSEKEEQVLEYEERKFKKKKKKSAI
jgi:hypothetical protein